MECEEQKSTHETQSSAVTFCSSHAMASSVIYYSTEAQKMKSICFITINYWIIYTYISRAVPCHLQMERFR